MVNETLRSGRSLLLLSASLLGLSACGAEPVTQTEQDLYVASKKLWQPKSIPVCWENPGADATERGWVRDAALSTWPAVSRVELKGWGTCAAGDKGIRIRIEDSGPHTKGLGKALDGVAAGMVLNFTFKNWSPSCQSSRESCIRVIAVHEFGHALGFAHEQNRKDTPSSCTEPAQGESGDLTIGAWDLSSVMNYCNPRWNGDGRLSATDIAGVQSLYGARVASYDRQASAPLCPSGTELQGGLCVASCAAGYRGEGLLCRQVCPSDYRDSGASCTRGLTIIASDHGRCPWYDACGLTFARGCSQCPAGYINDGCTCRRTASSFVKNLYARGQVPAGCPAGKQLEGAQCLLSCDPGYRAAGPSCLRN